MDLSESETGSEEDVTGKPVIDKTASGKPCASSKSDCQGGPQSSRSSGGSTNENQMILCMTWT